MSEGGLAGTAWVDLEPRFGAGFAGALAGKLKTIAGPAAVIAAGAAVFSIGEKFDGFFNKIKVQTGATGGAFDSLKNSAKNVLAGTAGTFDQVSAAVGGLYQRTRLTGPALDELAKKQVTLARITKTDVGTNVEATTSLFARYGVAAKDQSRELDVLFKASQQGGKGLATLVGEMQKGAPGLTAFGFGIDKSAALISGLERAGVNVTPVLTGLRTAFGKIAKEGGDPQKVLAGVFKELRDGKDPTKATADAIKLFGARGGKELSDAVRAGRFDVDKLFKTITDGKGGINETGAAVSTIGGKFAHLKNIALVAIEPIATALVDLANKGLGKVVDFASKAGPAVASAWDSVLGGFQNPDAKIGPSVGRLERILLGVGATTRKVADEASKDWSALVTGLSGGDTSKVTGVAGAFAKGGELIRGAVRSIITDAKALGPVLAGAFEAVRRIDFKAIFGRVGDVIAGVITAVKGFDFGAVFGRLKAVVAPILPPLIELGRAVFNLAVAAFPVLLHAGQDIIGFAIRLRPLFLGIVAVGYVLARVAGVLIAGALKVVAGATQLLAHHAGILRPILLALVAGFVSLKVVQGVQAGILGAARAAGTAVGTFQRLGTQAVSLFKSGSDTLRLRLMYARDAATKIGGALKTAGSAVAGFAKSALSAAAGIAKQTAAWVAQKAAAVASAVATKAMAAAQWLLNTAMDANPVVLIVAGIAALVAGVVLAYQHFKPFRDVVDAVGRALASVAGVITGVVSGAFDWIKSHWPLLLAILTGPFGIAVLVISRNWSKITEGAATAFHAVTGFFSKLPGRILGLLSSAGRLLLNVGQRIIQGLLDGVVLGAKALFAWYVRLPLFILGLLGTPARWLLDVGSKALGGLLTGAKSGAKAVWSWFTGLPANILHFIGDATGFLVNVGEDILNGLLHGLENIAGKVGSWISDHVSHWKHLVTHPWEILSPSKFTQRVGENIGLGLLAGLDHHAPAIARRLSTLAPTTKLKAKVDVGGVDLLGHAKTFTAALLGGHGATPNVSAERFRGLVIRGLLGISGILDRIDKGIAGIGSSGAGGSSSSSSSRSSSSSTTAHHAASAKDRTAALKYLSGLNVRVDRFLAHLGHKPTQAEHDATLKRFVELDRLGVKVPKTVDARRFAGIYVPPHAHHPAPTAGLAIRHLAELVGAAHHQAGPTLHQENHFHAPEVPTKLQLDHAGRVAAFTLANTGRRPGG